MGNMKERWRAMEDGIQEWTETSISGAPEGKNQEGGSNNLRICNWKFSRIDIRLKNHKFQHPDGFFLKKEKSSQVIRKKG